MDKKNFSARRTDVVCLTIELPNAWLPVIVKALASKRNVTSKLGTSSGSKKDTNKKRRVKGWERLIVQISHRLPEDIRCAAPVIRLRTDY
jgi:hypothetical protein